MHACARSVILGVVVIALSASVSGALVDDPALHDFEFPLVYDSSEPVRTTVKFEQSGFARGSALPGDWFVQEGPRTGHLHAAYGGDLFLTDDIADADQATALARDFLVSQEELLGTNPGNMEFRNVLEFKGRYAVHFRQIHHGVPVYRGDAWVVITDEGKVAAFGSDFFPERHAIPMHPTMNESDAIAAAAQSINAVPRTDRPIDASLSYVPAPSGELLELTLAYRVAFEAEAPFGRWLTWVDARSGAVLGRTNEYHAVNVVGTVASEVEDYGYCDGVTTDQLAHVAVSVSGGGTGNTDENGNFDISHAGSADVTVDAYLNGPYINVNRYSGLGADAHWTGTATPGTPLQIGFNSSNARRDEMDSFFHGNRVHDFMKGVDPSFTSLDYSMTTIVGRSDGYCPGNAWWDGSGMNYCDEGSGYGNTGQMGNVVYHEYGHGVSQEWYIDNGSSLSSGDMHEGNSDILGAFVNRESIVGLGFYLGNCTSGIRNSDNTLQWPGDNNGGHYGGQIIAGFFWDSWQSMLAMYSQADADTAAWDAWHYGRGMGTPHAQDDQVLWTFIADDDDGDLNNGTPNHSHFCLGATNHGFTCPEILTGVIILHSALPTMEAGGAPVSPDVTAVITSSSSTVDPLSLRVSYSLNGAPLVEVPMTATGNPDEYSAPLPTMGGTAEVEYFIYAADMAGNERTDPSTAPSTMHAFDVVHLYDDLESGSGGWTVGLASDGATTGQWELADPIGTQAQPEDDSTPAPGTMAFITGQCSGSNCWSGCSLGCNDIDNGETTLLTPIYDLAGASNVKVKYDAWYSNNTGATPSTDYWVVDVSNDGGSSWTNIVNTNVTNASWTSYSIDIDALFGTPDQVQVRFVGSDLGSGSLVEAAVDELRILADYGATDADEVVSAAAPAFSLSQNRPNPLNGTTRIDFSVPGAMGVDLTVYNVSGQTVKRLAIGNRDAGAYRVEWDGRDAAGTKVAAGVYFYRLTAGEKVLTRKMTVTR
ncbi:MAG: FlgD immunoglobulin-like domain containing protein [Gemmatimonadota bacterium]|nr:FlgD immunoglobulin-like domain containing protein [Gemmatimonadota bacterium]